MKKIIAIGAFLLSASLVQAQTDSARTRYDYYPDANVYYNDKTQSYWYQDSASRQWKSNGQLPSTYHITGKTKKNTFYYNGADVWKQNADHTRMYGSKKTNSTPATQPGNTQSTSSPNTPQ